MDLLKDLVLTIIQAQGGNMGQEQEQDRRVKVLMEDQGQEETPVMRVVLENLEMFKLNQEDLFQVTCNQEDQILE